MKKLLIILCACFTLTVSGQQAHQYTVSGSFVEYPEDPLNKQMEVYLVNTSTVTINYQGMASGPYQWYRYTTGVPGTLIPGATGTTLANASSDYGYYLVANGAESKYVWIVNYTKAEAQVQFQSLTVANAACTDVTLLPQMTVPPLVFYTNMGTESTIARKYAVTYETWDPETFRKKDVTERITGSYTVSAPLQDTRFTLFDWYADQLGEDVSITSDEYAAIAVTAQYATVEIVQDTADNVVAPTEEQELSAPARGTFTANANEPVAAFYVWYVYKIDESTENPVIRYTDKVLRYTFERQGKYEIRLEVSDRTSTCKDSKSFTYTVTDFLLKIPNAFSPGTTPGINDEFKVSYRSVVSFKAWIFNRWGKQLYHWANPEQGWDGKVNGRLVPPGVYFYIIEAKGSDGKVYTKKGDINVLRAKDNE